MILKCEGALIMGYEYDKSLFSEAQQEQIEKAIFNNVDKEIFYIMMYLDENDEPMFGWDELYQIAEGVKSKLPKENIKKYCKLNNDGAPVYDDYQMEVMRYLFEEKYSESIIDSIAKIKNDSPAFSGEEMGIMYDFIIEANEVTLKNINFINGKTKGGGGAIVNYCSNLKIINCCFKNK